MPALAEVARKKLQALEETSRLRTLASPKPLLNFASNDYLGLSQHPRVKQASIEATERYGTGAGASRLVTGNHPLYAQLETKVAKWKQTEAALVFGSGYLANIGTIPALVGKDDLIVADKLVHACLLDGAKLSDAKLLRFQHNDAKDCARLLKDRANYRHCLIITEEVFSMDGDVAPLAELHALAAQNDSWLMVDSAHAVGASDFKADIKMGTFSKAFGSYGGYVCATKEIIEMLATTARSLMFTTGLPPAVIAAAGAALDIIQSDAELVKAPLAKAKLFTKTLGLPEAQSPIVPLILGDEARALAASKALEEAGFLLTAIRPPTVPEGTARLRFAFSAMHKDEDIMRLAALIKQQGWA